MNNLHLALIGKSLAHSFSGDYFRQKFHLLRLEESRYTMLEMPDLDQLRENVASLQLDGFNVTIPYKQSIIPLLDDIDPVAMEIGAVNTVKVDRHDGRMTLTGYNTDAPAFLGTIRSLLCPHHRQALILGTGGAAHAVAWALSQLTIESTFVSRSPDSHSIGYHEAILRAADHLVIVNATPVGTSPHIGASPWPSPELLTSRHLCYDLVYNPSPTLFLRQASSHGATTKDGLQMLHLQADLAFKIWTTR